MNAREPRNASSSLNLLAIVVVAATFLVIALVPGHRWLGLWLVIVLVGFALMPMPGREEGDDRVMNMASAVLGIPVALRRETRERIDVDEVPAAVRRAARLAVLVVFLVLLLLLV